jgi:hypothetical protein
MTALGYQHAYEAGLEHGRFPATSRPSRSNVSFLPVFVGFTPGGGPTVKRMRTAARDPKRSLPSTGMNIAQGGKLVRVRGARMSA